MKLALISDTHDSAAAIRAALDAFRTLGVDLILHCGDICRPGTVRLFDGWQTVWVLGNGDWRTEELQKAIAEIGGTCYGDVGEIEPAGRRVCWMHGHRESALMLRLHGGQWDYVASGHTHTAQRMDVGPTCYINPGALNSVAGGTFAVLDVPVGTLELKRLSDTGGDDAE